MSSTPAKRGGSVHYLAVSAGLHRYQVESSTPAKRGGSVHEVTSVVIGGQDTIVINPCEAGRFCALLIGGASSSGKTKSSTPAKRGGSVHQNSIGE